MGSGARRVLIVDNLPDNRQLLVGLLDEEGGFRIVEATSGREALDQIGRERPDLVLLDLAMPEMDGFEVLERIKELPGPFLPVIVVTVLTEREARLRALKLGAHEFLTKPIDGEELLVRVKTLLALKEAREEIERQARELRETNERLESVVATRTLSLREANEQLYAQTVALSEQRNFAESLIDNLPGAFAYLDHQLIFERVNAEFLRLIGRDAADVLGRKVEDVLEGELRQIVGPLGEVVHARRPRHGLTFALTAAGRGDELIGHWDFTYAPVPGADGLQGVLLLAVDASERVEKERLLRAHADALELANAHLREADRIKDEFLSVISHELRTPLNFITGFASVLDDGVFGALNESQSDAMEKILTGADRMVRLVNDLLDYAKIHSGRFDLAPTPTMFVDVVREAVELSQIEADRKHITIKSEVDVPDPVVIDGARIGQVLLNLISNAIKFSDEGKLVRIEARVERDSLITRVHDRGRGIAAADVPKLFTRFQQLDMSSTRPHGGTGLGLAISKALVEAHGGEIGVDSAVGEGSTFWFALPLTAPSPRGGEPKPQVQLRGSAGGE